MAFISEFHIDKDLFDCDFICVWANVYSFILANTKKGMMMAAFSSVDIAFRAIKGKDTGLPICKLVGGPHSREISYANGLCLPNIDKPFEYLIKEAEGYRA